MDQRLTYIHNNPVEAGFVDEPWAWVWAVAIATGGGLHYFYTLPECMTSKQTCKCLKFTILSIA